MPKDETLQNDTQISHSSSSNINTALDSFDRSSVDSDSSIISSILEGINQHAAASRKIAKAKSKTSAKNNTPYPDINNTASSFNVNNYEMRQLNDNHFDDMDLQFSSDEEEGTRALFTNQKTPRGQGVHFKNKRKRRILIILAFVITTLLLGSFAVYLFSTPISTKSSASTAETKTEESISNSTSSASVANAAYEPGTPGLSPPQIDSSKKLFTMDDWRDGKLRPQLESLEWVTPAPGESKEQLLENSEKGYALVDWPNRESRKIIFDEEKRVFSYKNKLYMVNDIVLSPNKKYAILITNTEKNYRHSSFADYFIYDFEKNTYLPLSPKESDGKIAIAKWSPLSDKIAYVLNNNLFIRDIDSTKVKQITKDGGADIFYGRPDWVYEEEVFASDTALWWSPKGDYLAYLRTNDSQVEEFPIPYFVQKSPPSDYPYPILKKIKYPKPGTPNPIVDLLLLDLSNYESFSVPIEENEAKDTEKLITEVIWTGDEKLIMRITDRDSSVLKVGVVDAKKKKGKTSRTVDVGKDGGWFEISQNTHFIPKNPDQGRTEDGYIDINVVDGYNHLVYYSPVDSKEPKSILTSGKWEVDDSQVAYNPKTNRVYFTATKKSPVERHVYSVKLDGTDLKALTDESKEGWYQASYSPSSRYVLLNNMGPSVPSQVVLDLESEDVWGPDSAVYLGNNDHLKEDLKQYHLPTQIYSQIKVGTDSNGTDIVANAVEYRPPNFNETLEYPVLFYVYGGPVSQMVQKTFGYSFQHVVASSLNAIVVTVDGRGTGFMGRDFRSVVRGRLGYYEVQDQITAAKEWKSRPYVDSDRVAIWGWSYGGFMTLKTLETDGGNNFKYGMAVAPVTDWRFYDSIYTERYMHVPEKNKEGYDFSEITDVGNMSQATRFLVMHGTGDDNVHFQHTLTLLDKLDLGKVENYDVHVFPDSDHSIYYHGANRIVYDKLLHWISNAFAGKYINFSKK